MEVLDKTGVSIMWDAIKDKYALKTSIPTKASELINDSGFLSSVVTTGTGNVLTDLTVVNNQLQFTKGTVDILSTEGAWEQIKEYIDSKLSDGDDNLPVGTLLTTYNNKNVFGDKWRLADGSILKVDNELYDTTKLYPNSSLITSSAEELFNSDNLSKSLAYTNTSSYTQYIDVLAQKKIGEYIYFVTESWCEIADDSYKESIRVIRFNINTHTIEYLYNREYWISDIGDWAYEATITSYGIVITGCSEKYLECIYCLGFDDFNFKKAYRSLDDDDDDAFSNALAFCISDEKVFFFFREGTLNRLGFVSSGSFTFEYMTKDTTGGHFTDWITNYYEHNGDIFIKATGGYMKLNPNTFVVEYSNITPVASFIQNLDDPNSIYYIHRGALYKTQEFPTGTIVATNTSFNTYSECSFLNFQGYNLCFRYKASAVLNDQYVSISQTLMPKTNVIYAYLEDNNTIIYICLYYNTSDFVITKYRVTYDQSWAALPTISNTFIKVKS